MLTELINIKLLIQLTSTAIFYTWKTLSDINNSFKLLEQVIFVVFRFLCPLYRSVFSFLNQNLLDY